MDSFLGQVARHIIARHGEDLSRVAIVFPNKRAALFLNRELARVAQRPIWSAACMTISDLFKRYSDLSLTDSIEAVAVLHKTYTRVTGRAESLDEFYGWGVVMLDDFDDIDKSLANAEEVFKNIRDIRELDRMDYLSTEQKEELRKFFASFTDDPSVLRERFIRLWSKLPEIYHTFRGALRDRGLAYEGMLYRDALRRENIGDEYEKYLFVGFNALQKAEQVLFDRLMKAGKAEFFWDYDEYYLRPRNNESGTYLRRWLDRYPNALTDVPEDFYSSFTKEKDIQFISAPTENLQARYATQWLMEGSRIADGSKTSIVLCNEGLLPTIIHCIPPQVKSLNVTTGYPLSQAPIMSLISQLVSLQAEGYVARQRAFRSTRVGSVLRHPYARFLGEELDPIRRDIEENHLYYVAERENGFLQRHDPENLKELARYLAGITGAIARNGARQDDALFDESLFRAYTLLERLASLIEEGTLEASLPVFRRLMSQLAAGTTIPFHGEPIQGLQIMGVLETRNLDFDNLLVLSCNEGCLPKVVNDTSLIPHFIRKAHNLTTVDNKVSIYGYYFHRMMQRARSVTVLYNNSTEGVRTADMSRFMQQMLVEWPNTIRRSALKAGQQPVLLAPPVIAKDNAVMQRLGRMNDISPTAICTYLRCELKFFFHYLASLKEPDAPPEDIDNRIFGNIFHLAAELMYDRLLPRRTVDVDDLKRLIASREGIDEVIDEAFGQEFFHLSGMEKTRPKLNGLQLINHEVVKAYLLRLLRTDMRVAPLRVLAHERRVSMPITFSTADGDRTINLTGRIDRFDEVKVGTTEGTLRVVDYKTGSTEVKTLKTVDDIFDPKNIAGKKSDYTLQAFLYSIILSSSKEHDLNPGGRPVAPALLFIQHAGGDDYEPVISLGGERVLDPMKHAEEFLARLSELLGRMFSSSESFRATDRLDECKSCPYRTMCGR